QLHGLLLALSVAPARGGEGDLGLDLRLALLLQVLLRLALRLDVERHLARGRRVCVVALEVLSGELEASGTRGVGGQLRAPLLLVELRLAELEVPRRHSARSGARAV